MRYAPALLLLLTVAAPTAAAVTFTEDFEDDTVGEDPSEPWYTFVESSEDAGNVTDTNPILQTQSFRLLANTSTTTQYSHWTLLNPTTLTSTTFWIQGQPPANVTGGTQQFVTIESRNPMRTLAEFYILCNDASNPNGCEFRVRWQTIDSTGQTLISTNQNETIFEVQVTPNWLNASYQLQVNGVNDGWFPFLELPTNIGRIRLDQYRSDVRADLRLDNWTIVGAVNGTPAATTDLATGIKNFADTVQFSSGTSKFIFGVVLFITIIAAVLVPLITLSLDNTLIPVITFFAVILAYWLIDMEFWPEWVGISLIIACAAVVASIVVRRIMNMRDATTGPAIVAGSLGYFIIASSLLAFSGYATATIQLPTSPAEQQDDAGGNTTDTQQTFIGAVAECVFSGGVFTFGLKGDCSQDTVTTTWQKITDAAGQIYGWIQAGVDFIFQLLTFRLPIPVLFNAMIVLPPASGLAMEGLKTIRGSG